MKITADANRAQMNELIQPKKKSSTTQKESAPVLEQTSTIDRIDLSSGFSLERINSMMESAIGKKVAKMFSDAGIEVSAVAGLDWTPEATATRIVDVTTGFLGIWRQQHPEQNEEESLSSFEKTIRGAIDQGYSQALSILGGAGLDSETVKSVAGQTIDFVHAKLDDFFARMREESDSTNSDSEALK